MNAFQEKTEKQVHLFPLLMVLFRARWLLLRNFLIAVVLVIAISFLLPARYTAVTTLMPPQEQNKTPMAGLLSEVSVPGLSLANQASSSQILVEILKSRSVTERVLQRSFAVNGDSLPLYRILNFPSPTIGAFEMQDMARFMVSPQDIISVIVEMGNAQLAADVANAYVEELDYVNRQKSVSRAKNSRVYIESQLQETQTKLSQAMQKLANFQQQNKAVSLENQMQASINQAGELMGQIMAKEVQIGVMMQSMKPENPLVVRAQQELQQLRKRYNEIQYGKENKAGDEEDVVLPFQNVPNVALQLADLVRDVKVQETVWELLNQQFYQVKIEEARNTPTVQVLDPAVPPPYRSSPNRKMLVIVFGLLSIVFTMMFVLGDHYFALMQNKPKEREKLQQLRNELHKDAEFLRQKIRRKS